MHTHTIKEKEMREEEEKNRKRENRLSIDCAMRAAYLFIYFPSLRCNLI